MIPLLIHNLHVTSSSFLINQGDGAARVRRLAMISYGGTAFLPPLLEIFWEEMIGDDGSGGGRRRCSVIVIIGHNDCLKGLQERSARKKDPKGGIESTVLTTCLKTKSIQQSIGDSSLYTSSPIPLVLHPLRCLSVPKANIEATLMSKGASAHLPLSATRMATSTSRFMRRSVRRATAAFFSSSIV